MAMVRWYQCSDEGFVEFLRAIVSRARGEKDVEGKWWGVRGDHEAVR